jgi:type VI protein secretion system component VasF
VRGGEAELAAIMDQLAGDLSRAGLLGPELLSVHGDRPAGEVRTRSRADLPVVGLAAAAVVISLVLYVGLRISLSGEVSTVLNRIAQFVH